MKPKKKRKKKNVARRGYEIYFRKTNLSSLSVRLSEACQEFEAKVQQLYYYNNAI